MECEHDEINYDDTVAYCADCGAMGEDIYWLIEPDYDLQAKSE